jgi:outer membrane protein assembly factor BamB
MKSSRTLIIIVLAVVLMVMVMACSVFITLTDMASREKYTANAGWQVPASAALSVNITDLTGDKQRDVFVQDADGIKVLDTQGQPLVEKQFPQSLASTQGDVDGDGVPDIVAYTWNGERARTIAFTGQDRVLWERELPELGVPGRAVALDFENDGRSEIVVSDEDGQMLALSAQGDELWRYWLMGIGLRGLDDVPLPTGDVVTVGDEGGEVVILDSQGQEMWRTMALGGLRRLRAFPLGGPLNGRVLVGSVNGELTVYQGDDGQEVWSAGIGQAVNEIRPAEIDGDPATVEIIAGGKDGGVWAFSQTGQRLWANGVGSKVNEIAGIGSEGLDGQAIIVGDDGGEVTVFDSRGMQLTSFAASGSIGRVEVGKLAGTNGFIVADSSQLTLYTLDKTTAPFWYTPILGGLLACGVIAIVAVVIASLKPAPTLRVSAEEMTVEAQKARRRMLHESIEDLKKMQERGEVSGQAYLARIRELREQLAEVTAALIKLGEPVQVESFACPHCGGPLELGTDRCEFCGQVVIV